MIQHHIKLSWPCGWFYQRLFIAAGSAPWMITKCIAISGLIAYFDYSAKNMLFTFLFVTTREPVTGQILANMTEHYEIVTEIFHQNSMLGQSCLCLPCAMWNWTVNLQNPHESSSSANGEANSFLWNANRRRLRPLLLQVSSSALRVKKIGTKRRHEANFMNEFHEN